MARLVLMWAAAEVTSQHFASLATPSSDRKGVSSMSYLSTGYMAHPFAPLYSQLLYEETMRQRLAPL